MINSEDCPHDHIQSVNLHYSICTNCNARFTPISPLFVFPPLIDECETLEHQWVNYGKDIPGKVRCIKCGKIDDTNEFQFRR